MPTLWEGDVGKGPKHSKHTHTWVVENLRIVFIGVGQFGHWSRKVEIQTYIANIRSLQFYHNNEEC